MSFHENRLLADDFHEISYLIFFRKLGKMSKNLLSAAVRIGALRVNFSKTCVNWPLKSRQKKVLMTTGSLMKVERIAECSPWSVLQNAPLGAFCNTFDLH